MAGVHDEGGSSDRGRACDDCLSRARGVVGVRGFHHQGGHCTAVRCDPSSTAYTHAEDVSAEGRNALVGMLSPRAAADLCPVTKRENSRPLVMKVSALKFLRGSFKWCARDRPPESQLKTFSLILQRLYCFGCDFCSWRIAMSELGVRLYSVFHVIPHEHSRCYQMTIKESPHVTVKGSQSTQQQLETCSCPSVLQQRVFGC